MQVRSEARKGHMRATIVPEGGRWYAATYDLSTLAGQAGLPEYRSPAFRHECAARRWVADRLGPVEFVRL